MDHFDERVKALQKHSLQVLPLKYRRDAPQKQLPVEALCEFDADEVWSRKRDAIKNQKSTNYASFGPTPFVRLEHDQEEYAC